MLFSLIVFIFVAFLVEGFHRLLANRLAVSVIEEKGEGFENGRKTYVAFAVRHSTLALHTTS
jgi:hypothetical protein